MGNKTITLRHRIIKITIEIVIGLISLVVLFLISLHLLLTNGVINNSSIRYNLETEYIQNVSEDMELLNYLDKLKVDYVIFDLKGEIKYKAMSDSNLIFAKEVMESLDFVSYIGGCCGCNASYIKELKKYL